MKKKTKPKYVRVELKWIGDAIAINPKGGCDFHMHNSGGRFCSGCGCCQLAKAYVNAYRRNKSSFKLYRAVEIFRTG